MQKAFTVSSVRFSRDGGTQIIEVVAIGGGVGINDGNANYGKSEYDETTGVVKTSLEWLSVEYNTKTNECANSRRPRLHLEWLQGQIICNRGRRGEDISARLQ